MLVVDPVDVVRMPDVVVPVVVALDDTPD